MTTTISNMNDTIDSRDIIERIEELVDECDSSYLDYDDYTELCTLYDLAEECEQYASDWTYGATLIRRSYWVEYVMEMLGDIGDLPRDIPWYIAIDEEQTSKNIEQDYTSVDYDGVEYLIRSV